VTNWSAFALVVGREVAEYRGGNARKMMSFVGALMKATKGAADPKAATEIFKQLIGDDATR
jgi:Asp-tRNA(Asn)/Glu-tRNA(Gln) amidotransferase B subunit